MQKKMICKVLKQELDKDFTDVEITGSNEVSVRTCDGERKVLWHDAGGNKVAYEVYNENAAFVKGTNKLYEAVSAVSM